MAERESRYLEKAMGFGILGAVLLQGAGLVAGAAFGVAHEAWKRRDINFKGSSRKNAAKSILRSKLERR